MLKTPNKYTQLCGVADCDRTVKPAKGFIGWGEEGGFTVVCWQCVDAGRGLDHLQRLADREASFAASRKNAEKEAQGPSGVPGVTNEEYRHLRAGGHSPADIKSGNHDF